MQIVCQGGAGGPEGHAEAAYNVSSSCRCLSHNACWGCMGPLLTGWIQSWQDDREKTVCVRCDNPQPNLQDVVVLTSLRGMPIGEAWQKFLTEEKD